MRGNFDISKELVATILTDAEGNTTVTLGNRIEDTEVESTVILDNIIKGTGVEDINSGAWNQGIGFGISAEKMDRAIA